MTNRQGMATWHFSNAASWIPSQQQAV